MHPHGQNNSSVFTRTPRLSRDGWNRLMLGMLAILFALYATSAKAQQGSVSEHFGTAYSDLLGSDANSAPDTGYLPTSATSSGIAYPASIMEPAGLQVADAQPLRISTPGYPAMDSPAALRTAPFDMSTKGSETANAASATAAKLVQYELVSPTPLPPSAILDVADYQKVYPDSIEYQPYTDGPLEYEHQLLPQGLIYRAYLAGEKESRFRSVWNNEVDRGWVWDITLGGRVGLYRYGSCDNCQRPTGFQIDIEGAGLVRLDPEENRDVDAADFRFGIPLTWGNEIHQMKLAYYHLSSHLGDEFLLKNPGYPRLNYSRDVIVLGHSYYMTDEFRLYGEVGYAMYSDVALQWEFQFGIDYAPAVATGFRGAPFAAVNAHLREEVNYGGNFVVQAGWAWRSSPSSGLFRIGAQYFNGESEQFSFYDESESKAGFGIWYDY